MDKPVLFVITAFFLLGGVDYLLGSRLKLGNKFEEGFKVMGTLSLGIIGIYSLSPALLKLIAPVSTEISGVLHIDPSILPACIFPVDMGGYTLSQSLARTPEMGRFSGIVVASSLGATIGFSIPVAGGFIPKEDGKLFAKGLAIGIISLPFGCFAAGLCCGIGIVSVLVNMAPIWAIALLLIAGLALKPEITLKAFMVLGRMIVALSIVGILLQGLTVTAGITLLPDLTPFGDTVLVVGKITLVLAGAYPMMEVLNRLLGRYFNRIGALLKINASSVTAVVGNLATNLLVFGSFKQMNDKGKVLCTALGVSCAFIFGGQFAYVASVERGMTGAFFIQKLVSGFLCVAAVIIFDKENRPFRRRAGGVQKNHINLEEPENAD